LLVLAAHAFARALMFLPLVVLSVPDQKFLLWHVQCIDLRLTLRMFLHCSLLFTMINSSHEEGVVPEFYVEVVLTRQSPFFVKNETVSMVMTSFALEDVVV
jgi:hypothetical protein